MSLAPEQTAAGLDASGEGGAESVGVGPSLGIVATVGVGPVESVGAGDGLAALGPELGDWLAFESEATVGVDPSEGAVEVVPRPQPASSSEPTARNRESRTVRAVRGRLGVTRQA